MDLLIKRLVNKPVDSNCFVLYKKDSSQCIIIDPGTEDCADLIDFLKEKKLSPSYIILTHEHFDHIWGVNKLRNEFNCQLICSDECNRNIIDKKRNLSVFYNQQSFQTDLADISIESINYQLHWEGFSFKFLKTPGHSKGSISIFVEDNFFCGDLIIKNVETVTKLPGGNNEELKRSLDFIFNNTDYIKSVVYPGHGSIFKLKELKN